MTIIVTDLLGPRQDRQTKEGQKRRVIPNAPSEEPARRVRLSEGRACRVRCVTLDYPFCFDGHDRHAPCMFKIAESMLKLVLVGWADPRRERSDRSGAARPIVRSAAPRSPETVSELDPGRFYGCRPNSHQGLCLWQARIDKEG